MDVPNNPKWEYVILDYPAGPVANLQKKLNELGDEGWELCGYSIETDLNRTGRVKQAVLKRRKS